MFRISWIHRVGGAGALLASLLVSAESYAGPQGRGGRGVGIVPPRRGGGFRPTTSMAQRTPGGYANWGAPHRTPSQAGWSQHPAYPRSPSRNVYPHGARPIGHPGINRPASPPLYPPNGRHFPAIPSTLPNRNPIPAVRPLPYRPHNPSPTTPGGRIPPWSGQPTIAGGGHPGGPIAKGGNPKNPGPKNPVQGARPTGIDLLPHHPGQRNPNPAPVRPVGGTTTVDSINSVSNITNSPTSILVAGSSTPVPYPVPVPAFAGGGFGGTTVVGAPPVLDDVGSPTVVVEPPAPPPVIVAAATGNPYPPAPVESAPPIVVPIVVAPPVAPAVASPPPSPPVPVPPPPVPPVGSVPSPPVPPDPSVPINWAFGIAGSADVNGYTITDVADDSPAERLGLEQGDLIKDVNHVPIKSNDNMTTALTAAKSERNGHVRVSVVSGRTGLSDSRTGQF